MLDPGLVARWRIGGGEDRVVLRFRRRLHVLREDDGETLPHGLLRGQPVERAVGGIDGNDGAIGSGKRHRLGGRLPDGSEALFTLAQRGLHGFPSGDLTGIEYDSANARFLEQVRADRFEMAPASIMVA